MRNGEDLGLVTTCNSASAGKWHREYPQFQRRNHISSIADNDEPGPNQARKVAYSLFGVGTSIRVMELPTPCGGCAYNVVSRPHVAQSMPLKLVGSAQPGVLPRDRNGLVIPSQPDVDSVAVAKFHRPVLGHWEGARDPYS